MYNNDEIQLLIRSFLANFGLFNLIHISFYYRPREDKKLLIEQNLKNGISVVLIMPEYKLCNAFDFGVNLKNNSHDLRAKINFLEKSNLLYKSLFSYDSYRTTFSSNYLVDNLNQPVWWSKEIKKGHLLVIGTDLVTDLVQYTQGDLAAISTDTKKSKWGFNFERINYLYESNLNPLDKYQRYADNWMELFAQIILLLLNVKREPILPNHARGAVIITGDDDQAYIEKYQEQQKVLGKTPITYFMHPLTKHNSKTIKKILNKKHIDIGLHPDALDNPNNYDEFFAEQWQWFCQHFKRKPSSVRNHGFLSDGYWGHLYSWLNKEIYFSSNVPGLDGTIVNGTLLPHRLFINGELTHHWSMLTAIGDGVLFALNYSKEQSAQCVFDLADQILRHPVPGIININLHPQNIDRSMSMHYAVLELIENGFYPMTMQQCYRWFNRNNNLENKRLIKKIVAKKIKNIIYSTGIKV